LNEFFRSWKIKGSAQKATKITVRRSRTKFTPVLREVRLEGANTSSAGFGGTVRKTGALARCLLFLHTGGAPVPLLALHRKSSQRENSMTDINTEDAA
jgi:hypothetical protein